MGLSENLGKLLRKRGQQLEETLRKEQYIQRFVFKEGTDPEAEIILRSMRRESAETVSVYTDDELATPKWIVLLGGTGAGKSLVLKRAYLRAIHASVAEAPAPFLLDLDAHLGSRLDLTEALDASYEGLFSRALEEHKPGAFLMVDSLDDRLLRSSPRFMNDLKAFLQRWRSRVVGCIIACRRAAYDPEWLHLSPVFFETYNVDHLGQQEFGQIIFESDRLQAFYLECNSLGISDLLTTPFDGFYLARRFAIGQSLPRTRRDCLNDRIDEMLRGTAADRKSGTCPPLSRLRLLARHLACLATFTGSGYWSHQEVLDHLAESYGVWGTGPITPDELRALFDRPLFAGDAGRFLFVHQLYREYLAAESLLDLPLRKQIQLLGTVLPGSQRVCTPYRGVAAFLAGLSSRYCDRLLSDDPLVALFAENNSLSAEQQTVLLVRVIELAVRDGRNPWWEVPPRGEIPVNALRRYRPANPSTFLRGYLTGDEPIARMRAAACAATWSATELNDVLLRICKQAEEHSSTRKWAMHAVYASGDLATTRLLYSLTADSDDSVRGDALQIYRHSEHPTPSDYLRRLRGGATDKDVYCSLQQEARQFGLELPPGALGEAFSAVDRELVELSDLGGFVLSGLFERAADIGFAEIPADFVFQCLADNHGLWPSGRAIPRQADQRAKWAAWAPLGSLPRAGSTSRRDRRLDCIAQNLKVCRGPASRAHSARSDGDSR